MTAENDGSDDSGEAPVAVVVSEADRASEHVGEQLLDLGEWETHEDGDRPSDQGGGVYHRAVDTVVPLEVRTFADLHLRLAAPGDAFSATPRLLVFASRHSGDTGRLLTCHFTGNFGDAEYGGDDRAFAPAAPGVQRDLVAAFDAYAPEAYGVGVECTHHGPTDVSVPSLFAELGSDEAAWDDPAGAAAVARAIRSLATDAVTGSAASPAVGETPRHLLGVGGGHYAPRFERVLRETAWGVGHVASEWQLSELGDPEANVDTLRRAVAASDAVAVLADAGGDDAVDALADTDAGVRVVSETWVRTVDDRALPFVDAVESALRPVADGLRFGARRTDPDGFAVVELPTELLSAARRVDAEAAREVVFDHAVAVETRENGNRVGDRAALPDGSDDVTAATAYDAVVDALVTVLREGYDEVERAEGTVTATKTSFDPAAARERGVPEGPAFGRLANGQPVEVDGETVTPGAVSTTERETFPVDRDL
ncbi:D-aminoacyl-tRNA deacylase [Halobaculum sp. MBLA0143]|uniref:D-aminoacyl-tRNA deacylase n=1 Tax=Halobaculum sp. MBLA0143 TaxID=3079933 RepID=UPI003526A735